MSSAGGPVLSPNEGLCRRTWKSNFDILSEVASGTQRGLYDDEEHLLNIVLGLKYNFQIDNNHNRYTSCRLAFQ